MANVTIHATGILRDALASDEIEVQATGGGASAHVDVQSILDLAGTVSKASILAALGITGFTITDTTLTITKLGADLVTRIIILPLE
jgi:hypothetical protein